MNAPAAGQTRLVIVGATEMVGGLKEVFHRDFADCSNGTQLRNCPPYVREWVTSERTEMHGRLSERGLEGREDIEDA